MLHSASAFTALVSSWLADASTSPTSAGAEEDGAEAPTEEEAASAPAPGAAAAPPWWSAGCGGAGAGGAPWAAVASASAAASAGAAAADEDAKVGIIIAIMELLLAGRVGLLTVTATFSCEATMSGVALGLTQYLSATNTAQSTVNTCMCLWSSR